jgi:hypothetical protein
LKAAVFDLDRPAAALADDVVVMLFRLACDVSVLACRQVQALQCAQFGEELQVSEERRPANSEVAALGFLKKVRGGEVTNVAAD